MRLQAWVGCGVLATGLLLGALQETRAQESAPAAGLRTAREFLRSHKFDQAVRQLERISNPGEHAGEVARLKATAWLGKALQADLAATEAINAIHRAAIAKHGLMSLADQPQNAALARDVEEQVHAYVKQAAPLAESWPAQFNTVLISLARAAESARRAHELAPEGSSGREEAAAVWAWADLSDYLLVRDVGLAAVRAETARVFAPELTNAIKNAVPPDRGAPRSEPRLRATLARLLPDAARSKGAALPLALAECIQLYSAARERLLGGRYGKVRSRFLSSSRVAGRKEEIDPQLPLPKDPAALLTAPDMEARLDTSPESLVLPLYMMAARDPKAPQALAASYGLYLALLPHNEDEAWAVLERIIRQEPQSAAVLLEKARWTSLENGPDAAVAPLGSAVLARTLRRPVFTSLPPELQPLWLSCRSAGLLAPQFLYSYRSLCPLARGLVPAAAPPHPAAPLLGELRFAELLMRGSLIGDVADGVRRAEELLAELQQADLPAPLREEVEGYRRRMLIATERVPSSLVHPYVRFTANNRTLVITNSGYVGVGQVPPGL